MVILFMTIPNNEAFTNKIESNLSLLFTHLLKQPGRTRKNKSKIKMKIKSISEFYLDLI